jgi:hypothetical protein
MVKTFYQFCKLRGSVAYEKIMPDAGKGGKLGRSNMAYWGTNDEAKAAGRKARRTADRSAIEEGVADVVAPERTTKRHKKRKH